MKYRITVLIFIALIFIALLLLIANNVGAGEPAPRLGDIFKTLFFVAPQYSDEKITSTPCVGDPANCAPLATITPTATEYLCPIEWCPNPPEGERCHCPISYTLIAPGG